MPVAAGPFQVPGSLAASSPPGRCSCVPGTQPGRVLSSRLTFNTIAQYVRFVLTPTDGASWLTTVSRCVKVTSKCLRVR